MCYIVEHMDRAGIRELRQHLSRYVERVKAGASIEVTERGRAVARLVPHVGHDDELAALERRGLTVKRSALDVASLGPVPKRAEGQRPLSAVLEELRSGERY
jgi:prevent-host-death family protein